MPSLTGQQVRLAIFGAVDGLVMVMGIITGLLIARQGHLAAWHAALGGAAGELVGMSAGQHTSDPASGWRVALLCGSAGGIACLAPAIPFMMLPGAAAIVAAVIVAVAVAAVICVLRPEKGWRAVAVTYGVLTAAGLVSGLTGLILCGTSSSTGSLT